ncbi:carboxypeptidase-like regulatory domain-containing protein [Aurantibacter crassamenti]|uniref:carboxypeptidase-like regulatory domain-containing protein n=1 Tax=Aurantibacter crassamenti TaxID=1837375 RepID=UPI00193AC4C7|nr:carboxypeptidase-like regulatory domain-containing protein [Aurantibacter crassamenti]MBM1108000.1 carboxypeptidase-like regulatory domain-containing protein [Aurantibacter crassamenti]
MKYLLSLLFFIVCINNYAQDIVIIDGMNNEPIPFATISFGDGLGTFADEDGRFSFSRKKYADIDSLFISAIGYTEKGIKIDSTIQSVSLKSEVSQLSEVIVSAPKEGKFKMRKLKAETHTDVFACWLPTVESEIAILFKKYENKTTQITTLLLPINAEREYKSKGKGKFATIFRLQYYANNAGSPGAPIGYENVIFSISEKVDKVFELDVTNKSIFIPENGIFISIQVLGYADTNGKLVDSKKYREIKTARGIQKISTSFRPLLPFVKGAPNQTTFVRRIFFNKKKWQVFDRNYNKNSKLIQSGNKYYAMGAEFKVYE